MLSSSMIGQELGKTIGSYHGWALDSSYVSIVRPAQRYNGQLNSIDR